MHSWEFTQISNSNRTRETSKVKKNNWVWRREILNNHFGRKKVFWKLQRLQNILIQKVHTFLKKNCQRNTVKIPQQNSFAKPTQEHWKNILWVNLLIKLQSVQPFKAKMDFFKFGCILLLFTLMITNIAIAGKTHTKNL